MRFAVVDCQDRLDGQHCSEPRRSSADSSAAPKLLKARHIEVDLGAAQSLLGKVPDFGCRTAVRGGNQRALDAHALSHSYGAGVNDFDRNGDALRSQPGGVRGAGQPSGNVDGDDGFETAVPCG